MQFQNEIEILKTLQHPHLIKFVDAYALQDRLSIIMSPVADESLTGFMSRFDQFPPTVQQQNKFYLWRWISCLASALAYLHDRLIRHQDIKPENILVKGDQIFLTDFGNATKFLDDGQVQVCDLKNKLTVTPMHCPPEAMKSGLQGFTADVFSLGCVYAEIITLCLDETLADFEIFRSPDKHDGAFRNQLEKTIEWIESLQEDYRRAALQHKAPPAVSLDMVCRMLDQDPEQRPTARQILLQLLPCTCCSTTVTAIEMTEKMMPVYPGYVESTSGKDENGNTPPQGQRPSSKITVISESEDHSLQESDERHVPRISSIPKEKIETVPNLTHTSDSDSNTDMEEVPEQRHRIGRHQDMRPYSERFRDSSRVASGTPAEVSKPRISRKSKMRSIIYSSRHANPDEKRRNEEDRLSGASSEESSSGDQNFIDSEFDVSSFDRIPPTRCHIPPRPRHIRAKAPKREEIILRQHTRFESSIDEPHTSHPCRTRSRGRFYSPRPMADTTTEEDSLARAFAAGYSTGVASYPKERHRRSPTPPLERRPPLSQSLLMSRSPSPSFERVRRLPSPPLRRPSPQYTRTRRPLSPPLRRLSPPLTSASCSVKTGSSIVSPSTEATSPRESLGSCVSIDESSSRRRADFRTEVSEKYINRTGPRLKVPSANYDEEYLETQREYSDLVRSHSKQLLHYNQRRAI